MGARLRRVAGAAAVIAGITVAPTAASGASNGGHASPVLRHDSISIDDGTIVSTVTRAPWSIDCVGDGRSGRRVVAVYVHDRDRPDRLAVERAHLDDVLVDVDRTFYLSAAAQGGGRRVR